MPLIHCPNCNHQFEPSDAFREEIQRELNNKAKEWQQKKEEEFNKKINDERRSIEEMLRKTINADFENKIKLLQQSAFENEERLKEARKRELEFLQKEQVLKIKEEELDITLQKKLIEEREKLKLTLIREENERVSLKEQEFQLQLRELQKQLDDQKKLADEMKRKAEQKSMQLQGEVQELALEEMLRNTFPFDVISEIGKGVKGADCVQTVRNNLGQECGKIIYESKRTTAFSVEWIEKLKTDMRSLSADIAVIVTKTMPKDMDCFGIKDGVWICTFSEVKALSTVLRDGIMRVYSTAKNHENKGDKMHLLYNYLTSNEFTEQWKAIREGFMAMKISIQKERDAMEKLWKIREKQLEKVLMSTVQIRGSIEGIAGADTVDLNLLEDNGEINLLT